MKRTIIGIILILMLMSCQNKDTQVVSTPHQIEGYNLHYFKQPNSSAPLPIIKTKINGKTAYFLLDTGASISLIDINQISKYNLYAILIDGIDISGIGGIMNFYNIDKLKSFSIDEQEYYVPFKGSDLQNVTLNFKDRFSTEILGILGSDFLEKYEVIFDYSRNILFTKI